MSNKLRVLDGGKNLLPFTFGSTAKGWHAIQSFTICPKEYQFAKVRKVRRRRAFLPEPLSIGLLVHAARAQYLHDGWKGDRWRKAIEEYERQFTEQEGEKLAPAARSIAVQCFEAYVAYWSVRPTSTVLAVEHEIRPKPLVPNAPEWAWRGARLDSVERWRGKVWLGEMKTTSASFAKVVDTYMLNGQTLLQAALYGEDEAKQFGPLGGILLDGIIKPSGNKKAKAVDRVPLPIDRMQHALHWFRRDFTTWVMQSQLIDWNSTPERRPVCMRSYGPCEFRDLCLRGRASSVHFEFPDGRPLHHWQPTKGKEVPPWE
jgi:hypothetical protein